MPNCSLCGECYAMYRCGDCKSVYYCNQQCQTNDWKQKHHRYCQLIKLKSSPPLNSSYFMKIFQEYEKNNKEWHTCINKCFLPSKLPHLPHLPQPLVSIIANYSVPDFSISFNPQEEHEIVSRKNHKNDDKYDYFKSGDIDKAEDWIPLNFSLFWQNKDIDFIIVQCAFTSRIEEYFNRQIGLLNHLTNVNAIDDDKNNTTNDKSSTTTTTTTTTNPFKDHFKQCLFMIDGPCVDEEVMRYYKPKPVVYKHKLQNSNYFDDTSQILDTDTNFRWYKTVGLVCFETLDNDTLQQLMSIRFCGCFNFSNLYGVKYSIKDGAKYLVLEFDTESG